MARSIVIIPGFGEGSWHTGLLMRELTKLGYQPATTAAEADVIITHSAGCFFLPRVRRNPQLVLINPPYWPGRSNWTRLAQKLWWDVTYHLHEHRFGFYLRKTAWNLLYIAANLLRVARIAQLARRHDFHEALAHDHVAIIRNDHDAWLMPHPERTLPPQETFSYYTMPGEHESCWLYPADHAALIHKIIAESR